MIEHFPSSRRPIFNQSPTSLQPVSDLSPTDRRLNVKRSQNGRRSVGDWSQTGRRLVAEYTSKGKTVAVVAKVKIKISCREVAPLSQALWDWGFTGQVSPVVSNTYYHQLNSLAVHMHVWRVAPTDMRLEHNSLNKLAYIYTFSVHTEKFLFNHLPF